MCPADLIKTAAEGMENAHAPYSGYRVGAALLCADGTIFQGCNVENASYGLTNCAERTAIFKAVSEGDRNFAAIAVVTENGGAPCGVCRQVMREFAPNLTIIMGDVQGNYQVLTLPYLLPHSFGPENLPAT